MMLEEFKDIPEFKGLYQVSNLGNVKSLPKGDGNGNKVRILKHNKSDAGNGVYSRVSLSKNGNTFRYSVHRLVALVFIPNPDNKKYVNHIDNNPQNNTSLNLEWCTHSENMLHAAKQGRLFNTQSKAGTAAGIKAVARFDIEMQLILGERFISSKPKLTKTGKRGRRVIIYLCGECGVETEDVKASEAIRIRSGICISCHKRKMI